MHNQSTSASGGGDLIVPAVSASAVAHVTIRFIKRHPVPSTAYVLGLILCLFFSGFSLTELQKEQFDQEVSQVDYAALDRAHEATLHWSQRYHESKGFLFSCNDACQKNYEEFQRANAAFQILRQHEAHIVSAAKSKVGIFSELGVRDTRDVFWERYSQGKGFAQRQTKFDAAFLGFRAMMRDESLMNYLVTMLFRVLFNFTLGVVATVVTFFWSSINVIRSYQASPLYGFIFFVGAALAALSFAVSWLLLVVVGVGGTAYATVRLAATNVRIENSGGTQGRNIHYDHGHRRHVD
ncbi:unnamed protein product [Ectocarpus fasciculatus]